jgi:hypothetical protein
MERRGRAPAGFRCLPSVEKEADPPFDAAPRVQRRQANTRRSGEDLLGAASGYGELWPRCHVAAPASASAHHSSVRPQALLIIFATDSHGDIDYPDETAQIVHGMLQLLSATLGFTLIVVCVILNVQLGYYLDDELVSLR